MSKGDVAKLPKWAQEHIRQLERDLETEKLRHREALLLTNPEDTDTRVSRFLAGDIGLPRGETVEFLFEPEKAWPSYIQARNTGTGVLIHGSDTLRLYPRSGNCLEVELVRR